MSLDFNTGLDCLGTNYQSIETMANMGGEACYLQLTYGNTMNIGGDSPNQQVVDAANYIQQFSNLEIGYYAFLYSPEWGVSCYD